MVKVNDKENGKKEVIVNINGKKWTDALDKAFKKVSKDATVDGFRKGKVPKDIYLKHYGSEKLWMEATDALIADAYEEALKESKLTPAAQPVVSINKVSDDEIEYAFIIVEKPEVKLGKYTDLKIKQDKVKVTDEEVDHEISHMREHYAEMVIKEGAIENNDIAVLDFEGFKDGVAFEGGKAENYSLEIGSGQFIPGFEEGLIGLTVGEEKDLELTFPKDYPQEDLAGAKVVFKVKINEIKTKKIPELDKEFFEDLGLEDINDEKSLKEMVSNNIKTRKERESENAFVDEVLKKASETMEVEIAPEIIDEEIDRMVEKYADTLRMQGIDIETYYKMTNSNELDLREAMTEEATNRVKYRLMLEEISKKEDIKVAKKELDEEIDKIANDYQMTKEQIIEAFGSTQVVEYDLKMRKTIDFLKEKNKA